MKHYTLQNLQYVQYSLRYSPDYNSNRVPNVMTYGRVSESLGGGGVTLLSQQSFVVGLALTFDF